VTLRPVWLQYPEERKRRMKIGDKKGETESALIFQSPFTEKTRERERGLGLSTHQRALVVCLKGEERWRERGDRDTWSLVSPKRRAVSIRYEC
jgi:hypothetical protein